LPGPWAYRLSRLEPFGFFILIGLLFTGILGWLLWPLIEFFINSLAYVSGLQAQQFMQKLNTLMGR
jgi:hypothetical protein